MLNSVDTGPIEVLPLQRGQHLKKRMSWNDRRQWGESALIWVSKGRQYSDSLQIITFIRHKALSGHTHWFQFSICFQWLFL